VSFFLRFTGDFSTPEADARVVRLTRNYRSSAPILAAAVQAIAPTTLVPGRRLDPARLDLEAPMVGLYPGRLRSPTRPDFVVRTVDELVGGLSHRSHDGRVDSRAHRRGDVVLGHRRAVPHRRAGRADRRRADRAGVPVQKRSHDRLLDRPGVAAIARELRFATGPRRLDRGPGAAVRAGRRRRCGQLDTDVIGLTEADVWTAVG
jgi:superfamily I DNA/RNA helicase